MPNSHTAPTPIVTSAASDTHAVSRTDTQSSASVPKPDETIPLIVTQSGVAMTPGKWNFHALGDSQLVVGTKSGDAKDGIHATNTAIPATIYLDKPATP